MKRIIICLLLAIAVACVPAAAEDDEEYDFEMDVPLDSETEEEVDFDGDEAKYSTCFQMITKGWSWKKVGELVNVGPEEVAKFNDKTVSDKPRGMVRVPKCCNYRIEKDDTLLSIAKKFARCSVTKIRKMNNKWDLPAVGNRIKVPTTTPCGAKPVTSRATKATKKSEKPTSTSPRSSKRKTTKKTSSRTTRRRKTTTTKKTTKTTKTTKTPAKTEKFDGKTITPSMLNCACAYGDKYAGLMNKVFKEFGISGKLPIAAFIAQTCHESGRYSGGFQESGDAYFTTCASHSAKRIIKVNGKCVYYGRGLVQITAKANYAKCGRALGLDLIKHPELLEKPENAFRSAGWWWRRGSTVPGCGNLTSYAKKNRFDQTTRCIFGNHYKTSHWAHNESRRRLYKNALSCLK